MIFRNSVAMENEKCIHVILGRLFLTKISHTSIGFKIFISTYIHIKQMHVLTHPRTNFTNDLIKPPLKFRIRWVITSHIKLHLITHYLISVKPCYSWMRIYENNVCPIYSETCLWRPPDGIIGCLGHLDEFQRAKLLAKVNWYLQSLLNYITE